MCVLQQKQIGKAHNGQERTRVHVRVEKVMELFTRKTTSAKIGAVSAPQLANSRVRRCPVAGVQCSKYCMILFDRTSALQAMHQTLEMTHFINTSDSKIVNQSELSRDCDNTPNRLHI